MDGEMKAQFSIRTIGLLIPLFLAGGCAGWSTDSLVAEGMERIYVPYFQNDTFYRDLEQNLTHEVIARVRERNDLILADEASAEMVLKGRIVGFRKMIVSEDLNNNITETATVMAVKVELVRLSDGEIINQALLTDEAEFFSPLGETLETAERDSFRRLSHRILSVVEKGF